MYFSFAGTIGIDIIEVHSFALILNSIQVYVFWLSVVIVSIYTHLVYLNVQESTHTQIRLFPASTSGRLASFLLKTNSPFVICLFALQ